MDNVQSRLRSSRAQVRAQLRSALCTALLGLALALTAAATRADAATLGPLEPARAASTLASSWVSDDAAPVNSAAPSVGDADIEGEVLTSTDGAWSPEATSYAYQWQRSGDGGQSWSDIPGATMAWYALDAPDVGDVLQVEVTAVDDAGSATVDSDVSSVILSGAPVSTGAPVLGAADTQGQQISTTVGVWSPAATSYSYQWQRSGDGGQSWSEIPEATSATYMLAAADVGDELRAEVTATNGYGSAEVDSDLSSTILSNGPANTGLPAISGSPERGQQMTVSPGSWSPSASACSYQWQRDEGAGFVDVPGARASRYTPALSEEGDTFRVQVTATDADGQTSAQSAQTGPVLPDPPSNTTAPTISGTAQRTDTLTMTNAGTWTATGNQYGYTWQR